MRALLQLAAVSLTHVDGPVRFGGHVDGQLHGGQLAAVQPGLGEAGCAVGDARALMEPQHLHGRVAGRGLASERGLHARLQVHRLVLDVQVIGHDCKRDATRGLIAGFRPGGFYLFVGTFSEKLPFDTLRRRTRTLDGKSA